jgi:hypothetical protein
MHHHTFCSMLFIKIFDSHHAWILSCFSLRANISLTTWPVFLAFQLSILIFFITFQMWFGLPYPSIADIPWCMCTHPIDTMGIYLWHCAHNNKHTTTHNVVCDTFVTIVWNVVFYMGRKQLQVFPSTTFNSSCRRIDIVFTKVFGIHTLVDFVIVDLTQANLFPNLVQLKDLLSSMLFKLKKKSYHNEHPTNQFLLLIINVFGCLNK